MKSVQNMEFEKIVNLLVAIASDPATPVWITVPGISNSNRGIAAMQLGEELKKRFEEKSSNGNGGAK